MKKNKFSALDILKPTLILGLVCFITALALALVNAATSENIQKQQIAQEKAAQLEVMPAGKDFKQKQWLDDSEFNYTEALDENGNLIGYIFKNSLHGYGGPITVNIGIDLTGQITGVKAIDLSETPNIGMKVSEDEFTEQFMGKTVGLKSTEGKAGENEVETISGATVSSTAFIKVVQMSLDQYEKVVGGNHE